MNERARSWARLRALASHTVRVVRAAPEWTVRAIGTGLTLGAQLVGAGAALVGLYLLFGLGITLLLGGVALLAVGTLAEMAGPRKGGR